MRVGPLMFSVTFYVLPCFSEGFFWPLLWFIAPPPALVGTGLHPRQGSKLVSFN